VLYSEKAKLDLRMSIRVLGILETCSIDTLSQQELVVFVRIVVLSRVWHCERESARLCICVFEGAFVFRFYFFYID
jgi:hypothetical protein